MQLPIHNALSVGVPLADFDRGFHSSYQYEAYAIRSVVYVLTVFPAASVKLSVSGLL